MLLDPPGHRFQGLGPPGLHYVLQRPVRHPPGHGPASVSAMASHSTRLVPVCAGDPQGPVPAFQWTLFRRRPPA